MALFSNKSQFAPRRRHQADGVELSREEATQKNAFRRNRTITGSSSSRVSATGELRADLKSPRVQTHELTKKRRHLGMVFVLVVGGCLLFGYLISQFTAQVVTVASGEASTQLDERYVTIIDSYYESHPIERLRFMTNETALTEYVQVRASEVADITVEGMAGFGKSSFVIATRTPIAGWSINGRQKYVDASGTAFDRNYHAAPSVQIIDKSGLQVEAGQAVASNRFLGFVGQVVGVAKTQGYTVTKVIIPRSTTRQIELRVRGVAFPIKLSVDRPAGEQVEDMARAITWLKRHNQTPEYLDVRISGRAFYRG